MITSEMNSMLIADFLESEVELALKQVAPLKTLGLDVMPPLFYQRFWQVVHHDVVGSVLSWLNTSILLTQLTTLSLHLFQKSKI